MESDLEPEKLPQDRWYWGWFAIFGLLAGFTPFVPSPLAIPCGVIGFGGLFVQMREGFMIRLRHLRQTSITRAHVLIAMRSAAIVMLMVLIINTVSLVFDLERDVNMYAMPRTVTESQKDQLISYLSKHDPYTVSILVVPNDQEARNYANQLYNALMQSNWNINPPDHGGPRAVTEPQHSPAPQPSEFKTLDEWSKAHDQWLRADLAHMRDEEESTIVGLCIWARDDGKGETPDPRRATPGQILAKVLGTDCTMGGLGNYTSSLSLVIGHRQLEIRKKTWLFPISQRIAKWLEN